MNMFNLLVVMFMASVGFFIGWYVGRNQDQ